MSQPRRVIASAKIKEEQPFIKDFAFYKNRFATAHKQIKVKLRDFGVIVERFQD